MATATAAAQDAVTNRAMETAVSKEPGAESSAANSGLVQQPPNVETVSPLWQWLLAGIALLSLFIMALMRQLSANRWRSKS